MASRRKTKSRRRRYSTNPDDYYISQANWNELKYLDKQYKQAHFKSQTYYNRQNPNVQRIMREQNRPYQPTLSTNVRNYILSRTRTIIAQLAVLHARS